MFVKNKTRSLLRRAFVYVILVFFVILVNLPSLNMAGTAFKKKTSAFTDLSLLPRRVSLENFLNVLSNTSYGINVLNSVIIAIIVTSLCTLIAALSGYAISRFHSPALRGFSVMLLVLQIFPGILLLMPLFRILGDLKLLNTRWSVILSYTAILLPLSIWMLKIFFDTIPLEIEESAQIDGSSYFKILLRIIMPLSSPGIAVVAIFCFVNSWNEYMIASILLRDTEIQTLSVGLQKFVQQFSADWAALMAASTIAIIPTIFFLIFAQRYIIHGLTAGAVKV